MEFSISAYLIGLLKGLPTMVLSLGMVWCLVRWEELLTARNVHRILRILVLSICGFAGASVISTVTWTPYDGKIHPMVTICICHSCFTLTSSVTVMSEGGKGCGKVIRR